MKQQGKFLAFYFILSLLSIIITTTNLLEAQVDTTWLRQHTLTTSKAYEEGNRNKVRLIEEGKWTMKKMPSVVYLRTPIERMPNMHEYGFYHIPYTVDLDPSPVWSNTWCMFSTNNPYGMHTFDGCTGTEFHFAQSNYDLLNEKVARVTAAADGIIVAKADGNFDMSCYGIPYPNNYIALEHSDGSRTYYYNLKNGDQNQKLVGDLIREGELIGYPGGSGSLTGGNNSAPRLFFELRDNANNVINPFGAPGCLGLPQYPSLWKDSTNLKNYIVYPLPLHLKSFKHKGTNVDLCGHPKNPSYSNNFNPGDSIYIELAIKNYDINKDSFYIDIYNSNGIPIIPTFLRPRSPLYNFGSHQLDLLKYDESFVLPTGGIMIPGTYKVVLAYRSDILSMYNSDIIHYITVGCISDYFPTANISGESGLIAGNNIISNQQLFSTSRVKYIAGNQIILTPGFVAHEGSYVMLYNEPCVVPPRLSDEDVASLEIEKDKILISPNPASDFITVKIIDYNSKAIFKIYNSTLQLVKVLNVENASEQMISLAEFENGIYFIDAQVDSQRYKAKFVVNK